MNNFHVYEAIGRGKHSTVYKGRKKKSIEYFAVKSVDKSQRGKVLNEVRMLHSLDHANVLKFYSWYETSAHFWLILEYCVGGDLKGLLEQDKKLPENSIHDLAYDLVKALQFLHSQGIIYCDLKPSNVLLDESGCMKLCDFGLARRLKDIEKTDPGDVPQPMRGTPCYMAPELFREGGVHSYASDFWALGCVLYECYAGRPPFVGNEFTQLVKSIISDPTPPLPDNPSRSFQNLINCLLMKDPAERLQWSELCEHNFWRSRMSIIPLPPQPAFENMVELSATPYLVERNGDKPLRQATPPKPRDGLRKKDENSAKVFSTPVKNMQSSKKNNTKPSCKADGLKGVNILRMSRIAKKNLQRERDKENYRRHPTEASENETEVKIENNDMELDFGENPEGDAPDDNDGPENPGSTEDEKLSTQGTDGNEENCMINQMDMLTDEAPIKAEATIKTEQNCAENLDVVATPPSICMRKAQRAKITSVATAGSEPSDISAAFWHPTDLAVKPVMPSRKGDKAVETVPMLPFEALPAADYIKLPREQMNAFNGQILQSLSGTYQVSEKQNIIKYLEMLSINSDAANIITNGPIMLLLIKMLRLSKTSVLRVQIASLMGLLIRYSTILDVELASSGILNALSDGLRDKHDKLRRFCMATLGELLFYISTQSDQDTKEINAQESPLKDNRPTASWQVPSSVIALVSSILRKGEDDLAQLYALRTIDNICSQGTDWTSRFASQDVIGHLCYIYRATGKLENTRLIAGSCLARLARFSSSCIHLILERLSFKDIACTLIKGNSREQQISLNLLNSALVNSQIIPTMNRYILSLTEEKQLVPGLISIVEQGTDVLRGKTLLFIALLCKNSRRWLPHFFCNAKLLSAVDRLGKEKEGFIHQCTESFVQLVASLVPGILDTVSSDIQQVMGGKRHGAATALTGRAHPKSTIHLFPVILHLLGSASFNHRVVTSHVLLQLANLMKILEAPFQARDDFQMTLLRVLEAATEEPKVILIEHKIFTSRILPSLSVLYKGNKDGDARFLCLKILSDVMIVIFSDSSLTSDGQTVSDLKTISQKYFLPMYPLFSEDEDPIPIYAQKLLVMLMEHDYVKVSDILNEATVSRCFEFLLGDLSNANVSNVKLCFALASAPDMETNILSQLQVVRRIGNLLEFVTAKDMDDFLEPTLELCRAFIIRGIGSDKILALSKQPALIVDSAFSMSIAVDQQSCVMDICDFGGNMGIYIDLVGSSDPHISDLASDCLVLLLKAAPREATVGLLTNLPKLSVVLDLLKHGTCLRLTRLLYCLAFSCRQYLAQGMIVSISLSALMRVEALVSTFKGSHDGHLADAASYLGAELQRLPRCG
uniref:Protein kinase domain-containing protein n=1 Tax=Oryza brachyantha TaxID=4533 RepID=J3KYF6_ORYBR